MTVMELQGDLCMYEQVVYRLVDWTMWFSHHMKNRTSLSMKMMSLNIHVYLHVDPCSLMDCRDGFTCQVNRGTGNAECAPLRCSLLDCSDGYVCEVDANTGVASCVGSCEANNGGCRNDQLCRIQQYNYSWCDPSPCRYPVCSNAPYGKE